MQLFLKFLLPVSVLVIGTGCSPVGMAVKIGMHVVGTAVDDEETSKLSQQLMGQPPAAADGALGQRVDVLQDVNSSRQWLVYKGGKMDVLNRQRKVVEVADGQIVAVELVAKSDSDVDIPIKLYYQEKAKGKSPAECEAVLGMGPPIMTLRSTFTGTLVQVYDASKIPDLSGYQECVVHYDSNGRFAKLDLVEVPASSG
jgi:hypothetical protein